jgi:hypothetical protein
MQILTLHVHLHPEPLTFPGPRRFALRDRAEITIELNKFAARLRSVLSYYGHKIEEEIIGRTNRGLFGGVEYGIAVPGDDKGSFTILLFTKKED